MFSEIYQRFLRAENTYLFLNRVIRAHRADIASLLLIRGSCHPDIKTACTIFSSFNWPVMFIFINCSLIPVMYPQALAGAEDECLVPPLCLEIIFLFMYHGPIVYVSAIACIN